MNHISSHIAYRSAFVERQYRFLTGHSYQTVGGLLRLGGWSHKQMKNGLNWDHDKIGHLSEVGLLYNKKGSDLVWSRTDWGIGDGIKVHIMSWSDIYDLHISLWARWTNAVITQLTLSCLWITNLTTWVFYIFMSCLVHLTSIEDMKEIRLWSRWDTWSSKLEC